MAGFLFVCLFYKKETLRKEKMLLETKVVTTTTKRNNLVEKLRKIFFKARAISQNIKR